MAFVLGSQQVLETGEEPKWDRRCSPGAYVPEGLLGKRGEGRGSRGFGHCASGRSVSAWTEAPCGVGWEVAPPTLGTRRKHRGRDPPSPHLLGPQLSAQHLSPRQPPVSPCTPGRCLDPQKNWEKASKRKLCSSAHSSLIQIAP